MGTYIYFNRTFENILIPIFIMFLCIFLMYKSLSAKLLACLDEAPRKEPLELYKRFLRLFRTNKISKM